MRSIGLEARRLGLLLGLGDLDHPPVCHGYANCCVCDDCAERQRIVSTVIELPRQPWDARAERDAA